LQYATFRKAKGGILDCKRWPFRSQEVISWKAVKGLFFSPFVFMWHLFIPIYHSKKFTPIFQNARKINSPKTKSATKRMQAERNEACSKLFVCSLSVLKAANSLHHKLFL